MATLVRFLKHLTSKQRNSNYTNVFNSTQSHRTLTIQSFPKQIQEFINSAIELCQPKEHHFVSGTDSENKALIKLMESEGTLIPLPKLKSCWLCRTDPRDVARVESKTFIITENKRDAIPEPKAGIKSGALGNWLSPQDMEKAIADRFPGCMQGRIMYVIPFSMGPVGGPLSKIGVQITDSAYVVASMRIMTRVGKAVVSAMKEGDTIVRALHSTGAPKDGIKMKTWPCDPERTIIMHKPETNEIVSYGSGYGGNSLLGKKCFALRIGSTIAKREGWLAEHMLILGITPPAGPKRYIAAAFPSACGKTNLAMLESTLPGYKVECVGDDIAWIRYNENTKMFHAINPENGFFGVAPGTSWKTNPNAMASMQANSFYTNVAYTSDGGVWWEGLDLPPDDVKITDWHGKPWDRKSKTLAAHPNSRFTCPASQCPIIDKKWEDPKGVPLSAILFGGRRPEGVPLIYESFSWEHGVLIGAGMRSEATAAAEFKGKVIMHDPFAMRPFFGYNFGHYIEHWLSMKNKPGAIMPKIFHVNWFRKGSDGKFLWPGYGDNIRVLDWVLRRVSGESNIAMETPIGLIPKEDAINLQGLKDAPNMKELLSVPKMFWKEEVKALEKYFHEQIPNDTPAELNKQLEELKQRLK